MIGDFFDLLSLVGTIMYSFILVLIEHKYVRMAVKLLRTISRNSKKSLGNGILASMYSPIIKGFNQYPKMSKSFPESSIHVDMNPNEIKERILSEIETTVEPENNVIYQMIPVSLFSRLIKSRKHISPVKNKARSGRK